MVVKFQTLIWLFGMTYVIVFLSFVAGDCRLNLITVSVA